MTAYFVMSYLSVLSYQLPNYEVRIQTTVDFLTHSGAIAFFRSQRLASDVAKSLDRPVVEGHGKMNMRVIEQQTFRQRLHTAVGPAGTGLPNLWSFGGERPQSDPAR